MPELAPAALSLFTNGRLDKDDPETARVLSAAVAAARRWCGWHVAPVKTDHVIALDGSGAETLRLPTLALVSIASIVDDGTEYTADDLYVSGKGLVQKRSGGRWSRRLGGVVVTMTHGFDDAPDFDDAVLSLANRQSLVPAGGRARSVGPFSYDLDPVGAGAFTLAEQGRLEQFRLERAA